MNILNYTRHHGQLLKKYITENRVNRKGGIGGIVDALGMTRQALYVLYEQPVIKEKHRIKLIKHLGLDADFFPEPLSAEANKDLIIALQDKCISLQQELLKTKGYRPKLHPIVIDADNNDKIAIVPRKAVAGYVKNYFEPEYIAELKTFSLPNFGTGFAFEIDGESMNDSKVYNSEFALCNELVESLNDITSKFLYIVVFKNGDLVCKKIEVQDDTLNLISTNPDYQPYKVDANQVEQIWKVKGKYTPDIYSV